jgi:hypothetical protein
MEALGETDVPSVRVLCKRLGITVWFMNKYFPAVRKMVAKRHRNCVAAETQRRHERLWRDVHHIAVELRNQGLYPSATGSMNVFHEGLVGNGRLWRWQSESAPVLHISK